MLLSRCNLVGLPAGWPCLRAAQISASPADLPSYSATHPPIHCPLPPPCPPWLLPTSPWLPQALKANPEGAPKELKINANYITKFGQVGGCLRGAGR